jgi:complex I intermediate-associated protein 30 (CIA30)
MKTKLFPPRHSQYVKSPASGHAMLFRAMALLLGALVAANAGEGPQSTKEPPKGQDPQTPARGLRLADFELGTPQTLAGTPWQIFTDASMGGKSTMQIAVSSEGAGGSQHALVVTGKLTPEYQWGGFAGIRAAVQKGNAPKDMGAFAGIQFYSRGGGKTYRVLLSKENVKDFNHFYAEFSAPDKWTLVRVPFSKLVQSPYFGTQVAWSATNVNAVGFLAIAEPGATADVKLEIDEIGFYSQE